MITTTCLIRLRASRSLAATTPLGAGVAASNVDCGFADGGPDGLPVHEAPTSAIAIAMANRDTRGRGGAAVVVGIWGVGWCGGRAGSSLRFRCRGVPRWSCRRTVSSGSGGRIRTYDQAVNSRPLYH